MTKQIVLALVAVFIVADANAAAKPGTKEGTAKAREVKDAAEAAKAAGGSRSSRELIDTRLGKIIDQYLGSRAEKETIIQLAKENKEVARALYELIQSKKSGKNAEIDEAQAIALSSLAKIKDLKKRLADSTDSADLLTDSERAAYNLVINVPKLARSWTGTEKANAANAIKILGESATTKSIEAAIVEVRTKTGLDTKAIKEKCKA